MIKLALVVSIALIFVIIFLTYKKKSPVLTLTFVLLVIQFFFTSFISAIADNAQLWEVSKEVKKYMIFRIVEVLIFPLIMLIYVDLLNLMKTLLLKISYSVTFILILYSVEYLLVSLDVIKYSNWFIEWSFITWSVFLVLSVVSQTLFNLLLKREGVIQ